VNGASSIAGTAMMAPRAIAFHRCLGARLAGKYSLIYRASSRFIAPGAGFARIMLEGED
jgi:hypothetical protein